MAATGIPRADNCSVYTDRISLLVEASNVATDDPECAVSAQAFSCQTMMMEAPDESTRQKLQTSIDAQIDALPAQCPIDIKYSTTTMNPAHPEVPASELVALGRTSNCIASGNNTGDITHTIRASCTNQYEMEQVATGALVKNVHQRFVSNLGVCDLSDKAMPQVLEEARRVAAYNAEQNGMRILREADLACNFSMLPNW
jgi:hypothetical protein